MLFDKEGHSQEWLCYLPVSRAEMLMGGAAGLEALIVEADLDLGVVGAFERNLEQVAAVTFFELRAGGFKIGKRRDDLQRISPAAKTR